MTNFQLPILGFGHWRLDIGVGYWIIDIIEFFMKIIFRDTGEVKDVSDGYARNYLIPKGLAIIATNTELKKIEEKKKSEGEEEKKRREELELTAKKIDGKLITVSEKVGKDGKLFGSVTAKEISESINSQLGFRIDKHNIVLKDPIKKEGKYTVEINFGKGVKANIVLEVL